MGPKENGKRALAATKQTKEPRKETVADGPLSAHSPVLPSSRSTIFVRLHTNGNQELQYQPGDHLGVFPGNHEDLVNALIERLEDAPPVNQLVKVELLEERTTALGNYGTLGTPPWPLPTSLPFSGEFQRQWVSWGEETHSSSQLPVQVRERGSVTSSLRDVPLPIALG